MVRVHLLLGMVMPPPPWMYSASAASIPSYFQPRKPSASMLHHGYRLCITSYAGLIEVDHSYTSVVLLLLNSTKHPHLVSDASQLPVFLCYSHGLGIPVKCHQAAVRWQRQRNCQRGVASKHTNLWQAQRCAVLDQQVTKGYSLADPSLHCISTLASYQ